MKPRVYVETSIVSYLTVWPVRDIVIAVARRRTEAVCRQAGVDSPFLCTPEQLVAVEGDTDEN